ncbi:YPR127W [Zygosaccharomyces parabailii]|uniref:ZYBA0S08-03774g1_1 n=1 Tax=Zygosaccharomyces bailii (strain CLIB 213 / ATCC 58445 / CBS 680 / BCRC 21525 / NBRC 1098 / NCYC 1416 / NRRL Y-2227) TaxID=1333698 RepID=A0A8J2T9G1_ZYGB2|nr:YPR127W [Zygosaccharomyces parabailii]CDF90817.1 ZYBA0S08-03774g1_1 [Zygosaccharomyces bailii CLIB 213]CDH09000.1 related to pyridoxal reductase [Zygosaccharomyces bailii ISA1307]
MSKTGELKRQLNQLHTGYGLMSLTWRADPVPQEQAFEAMELVVSLAQASGNKAFFNVGEFYGPDYSNLELVKAFFEAKPELREHVLISCKGGIDNATLSPKGKYADVLSSIEQCVKHLGTHLDIFEVARLDKSLGGEYPRESFEAMASMVDKGIIDGISLSEVTADEIRAIGHDWAKYLVCVEVELSMFSPQILHNGVLDACNNLGLIVIAYSPLGRGLLTGTITKDSAFKDFRSSLKRFQKDSLQKNLALTEFLQDQIVDQRSSTNPISLPQVALGWVKSLNNGKYPHTHIVPIPSGSDKRKVKENFDESRAKLTVSEIEKINEFLKSFNVVGDRYEWVS